MKKVRLYALKHYTESGDLKSPPILLYLLLFISRTWLLLVISIVSTQTGDKLLQMFYPEKLHFYLGLIVGFFPVIIFLVSGRRHAQDKWALKIWPYCFYLLAFGILGDLILQLYYLYFDNFKYSVAASIQLVLISWSCIYALKSKRLKDSFKKVIVK